MNFVGEFDFTSRYRSVLICNFQNINDFKPREKNGRFSKINFYIIVNLILKIERKWEIQIVRILKLKSLIHNLNTNVLVKNFGMRIKCCDLFCFLKSEINLSISDTKLYNAINKIIIAIKYIFCAED